nr:MAG TPA: hypothetical protein [Caudoviricetes sp.]
MFPYMIYTHKKMFINLYFIRKISILYFAILYL